MTKRSKVIALVVGLVALPAVPAAAGDGAWACAAIDTVDLGVCVYDPVPPPPR